MRFAFPCHPKGLRVHTYVVVRINLYDGLFAQAFVCVRASSRVSKHWFASHAGVVGYHRDTCPIIIFNLINQDIRDKCILKWNTVELQWLEH